MSFVAAGIGAGLSAASSIYGIAKGAQQQKEANKIHPQWQPYVANPYAARQLGLALQLYNGRMEGASAQERNIGASEANLNNSVQRNATSGSQALSAAIAGQAEANASYDALGNKEAQNKYNLLDELDRAYATNISEGDKEYNSMLQKYQMDINRQAQLAGAGAQSIQNGISNMANTAFGAASLMHQIGNSTSTRPDIQQPYFAPQGVQMQVNPYLINPSISASAPATWILQH